MSILQMVKAIVLIIQYDFLKSLLIA